MPVCWWLVGGTGVSGYSEGGSRRRDDRNGRKVEVAYRRKSFSKNENSAGSRWYVRSAAIYAKKLGKGGRIAAEFGLEPESSRIKDIINGRTRDRHTYVRPECPAINTPVATKLDENEEERGAGV